VVTPSDPSLYLLFDRSPIGMYRTSEDGSFRYCNRALARLLGYTVDELMTKNLDRDIYVDATARTALIAKYRPLTVVDGAEVEWRTREGRILTVQIWGHVVESESGASFDASVLDVTDLKRQREDLERTAKILDQVVRQMPAMYWIVDRDLRILRTGGAIFDVLGYAPDRFVGATLQSVHRHEPGTVDPEEFHHRAIAGEACMYDTEYRGKQLTVSVTPYRMADGVIVGAIGTSLDVTHSRQLERRMLDAQRAESLGVLAGGLAHDFNNLLVAVIGNADLALRDIPPGTPGRNAIVNIRDAGLAAAELTHQLLAYAGRGGVGTTRVFPAAVVDELLRITATSTPENITITADIPRELSVRGDPAQLRQVLMNLITNARDALTDGGRVAIRARSVQHDGAPHVDDIIVASAGAYVALEVTDNGPGMDSETRRHVFEPFFTTKDHGHGLGLAAALGIVRAHGGGLRLRTSIGNGATFAVLWPAAPTTQGRAPTPPPVTAARTILVIDDEDLVRDVVVRMIEDLGYATLAARDGATGLAMLETETVDAVLVDMTMPRMSGATVIEAVRARRPQLPCILCSGFDREGRGLVRADAYLPKPFRIDVLERTLAKLLPP